LLEVIAVRDIQAGESLRLNLQPAGTVEEKRALASILEESRHPIPWYLQDFEDDLLQSKSCEQLNMLER
jgi:hypothetical protein